MALDAKQLEARLTGIGGSDAAAVCGISPWKTPLALYREKVGDAETSVAPTERMYWGNQLEDLIAEEYSRRTGMAVRRRNQMMRHREHNFMLANLDRVVIGQPKLLEVKTADKLAADDWGRSGTDEIPDYYRLQVMHYMIVAEFELADVAVLIGGNDFRIYTVPFDFELAKMLIARESQFWDQVERRVPPPPMTLADVESLYPVHKGRAMLANEKAIYNVNCMREAKRKIAELERYAEGYETELKAYMGDCSALLFLNGSTLATWKSQEARRLDVKGIREAHPEFCEPFIQTTTSRVFRLKSVADAP